jgi:uncharacterized protein (DUF1778 family)
VSDFSSDATSSRAEDRFAERARIVLNAEEAARFLDALEHPERFAPGLAWPAGPSALPS